MRLSSLLGGFGVLFGVPGSLWEGLVPCWDLVLHPGSFLGWIRILDWSLVCGWCLEGLGDFLLPHFQPLPGLQEGGLPLVAISVKVLGLVCGHSVTGCGNTVTDGVQDIYMIMMFDGYTIFVYG